MTDQPAPIPEDDLHAYVDGQLPPERRAEVEAWLAADPEAAALVASWQDQNATLRALFPQSAAVEADRALVARLAAPSRRRWPLAAAAAALFGLGAVTGALVAASLGREPADAGLSLSDASRDSYLVYAGEVRHPVEVGSDQEAHLVAWLGKRLGTDLAAPDLGPQGFHLVGGRLVPYGAAPGAMLMYEDAAGNRLTCLIARSDDATETGFRFAERAGVSTFYWVDGGLGYAISGPLPRDRLLALANAVYGQI